MPYPQAPWTLKGYAIQTLHLIDIKSARKFIPEKLEIVSVLPGKTLATVYVSAYKKGSLLEYNELIVAAGLVRYGNYKGSWISHIYVDHPDSVSGGREIWGLPKELAEFHWNNNDVIVCQANQELCSFTWRNKPLMLNFWQPKINGDVLSILDDDMLSFSSQFNARLGLSDSKLNIPESSPFSGLNLGNPLLKLYLDDLTLIAGKPKVVSYSGSAHHGVQ
ncbi:MAG TPA: acetoacetate decarboxylase family protein [Allocoleopsis sp.]